MNTGRHNSADNYENVPATGSVATDKVADPAPVQSVYRWAFWGLILTIAGLFVIYNHSRPVTSIPDTTRPVQISHSFDIERVSALINRASSATQKSWKKFEGRLIEICDESESAMLPVIRRSAAAAAGYGSCVDIIYYLAADKVWGGNRTEAHIRSKFEPEMSCLQFRTEDKLNAAILEYENELKAIHGEFSENLSRVPSFAAHKRPAVRVSDDFQPDFSSVIDKFGLDLAIGGISLGVEAAVLLNSQFISQVLTRATAVASRVFAGHVAKTAGSVAFAAADGPLPVGDIIAGIGLAWVAWDISSSRAEFEQDLVDSLSEMHRLQLNSAIDKCAEAAGRLNAGFDQYYSDLLASLKGA